MQLFYGHVEGDRVVLSEDESKHAIRVLRKKSGDIISVIDGNGNLFTGPIIEEHQKHCTIQVEEHLENWGNVPYDFHLAIAPTKNMDRLEWLLEKSVEIGISRITPILCEHSERKVLKPERLERILLSGVKQSLKGTIPQLDPLTKFDDFISQERAYPSYIGYCGEGDKTSLIDELRSVGSSVCVMIGPEGDFSPEEFHKAISAGVRGITLGDQRLRTETAALAAVHTAHIASLL
ncbi:MAG: 16S rRNA (uracil(1498)-N(3))-methyltransferase [Flavobacteriia bacterium]|nr:16S rRNA (uracil(1498)-N(3))-methyltransferase [Flavobacteriia bacterium]